MALRQDEHIAVFAQNLQTQLALRRLLLKIVAVFGAEADDADLRLTRGEYLQRTARVAFQNPRVQIAFRIQGRNILRCCLKQPG